MAELTIRPEEIRDALDAFVQSYDPTTASREEIGRVSEAGDGIARVEGLPGVMANELLRFEDGTLGLALNLDVREIGVVILGEFSGIEEGQEVRRTGEILSVPVGDAFLGRVVDPLGNPIDGLGDIQAESAPRPGAAGADRRPAAERQGAADDGHQGDRLDDADRPRPAPAHHRRPADRQVGDRDRHDHQPEGQLGIGRPQAAGPLHLRRHRPEGLDDLRRAGGAGGERRHGVHDDRRGSGVRPRRLQVPGALHGLRHRPALDVRRQARAHRLRRPVEAGRRLPRGLAAAAPAAGPRGVPGRRLLPAQPAARALRQALATRWAAAR